MALIFGSIIIITGISILRKTTDNLLDRADINLLKDLADTLNHNRKPEWIDIHNVKVLKSGTSLYMDCDLTIPWYYNIDQGHRIGAQLQKVLNDKYSEHAVLNIHLDPCNILRVRNVANVCVRIARIANKSLIRLRKSMSRRLSAMKWNVMSKRKMIN